LECGGNLFDAVSMAVKAALFSTVIPRVSVTNVDGGEPELEVKLIIFEFYSLGFRKLR
jgi:exosome complex component RRP42